VRLRLLSLAILGWGLLLCGLLSCGLLSCEARQPRADAIGEAYAGPAVLKIRRDIPLESPVVATLKHGERLELLQKRRRFFRVRVASGVEGWTDERQLMAKEDMDKLQELAAKAVRMPQQGQATTFGQLNVHTEPYRQSPSFLQIQENEKVDVLEHVITPRIDLPPKSVLPPAPKKPKAEKKAVRTPRYPPLAPLPPPPGPPPNVAELSKTDLEEEAADEDDQPKESKPVSMDNWSLVRTKDGESGWALTSRLVMAIPDEVAQYAEGHRIVSYFPLGEVQDGDQVKHDWLWTTISDGIRPYDFESFRVFIWSLRRHRYETAYIQRNLHGYAPVLLEQVELPSAKGTSTAKYPGFSVCVEDSDGQRTRREYAFLTNIVKYAGERPCEAGSEPGLTVENAVSGHENGPNQTASVSLTARIRARLRRWLGR
jgi:hypothetical protein